MLGLYTSVLPVLKEYVCLFQRSECLVHKCTVFQKFLTMFMRAETFAHLSVHELKEPDTLNIAASANHQPLHEMFVGATAKKAMAAWDKKRRGKFLQLVQSAYVACGRSLQAKLPLNNELLMSVSVLDPACHHSHSLAKAAFNRLPNLATNVVQLEATKDCKGAAPQMKNDALLDAYSMEVIAFCSSSEFGQPSKLPVCEWWMAVEKMGKYPQLTAMAFALMTCFHGPVESSFSVMNNILDDKSTRMGVDTYSAIQTVKYALHSTGKPAVECFARKDVKHTPVNHRMCRLMRGAAAAYKGKLKKAREERDEKQAAMSRQHQAEISRLRLKALNAEAEKQARLAHKKAVTARLKVLVRKRSESRSQKPPAKKARTG